MIDADPNYFSSYAQYIQSCYERPKVRMYLIILFCLKEKKLNQITNFRTLIFISNTLLMSQRDLQNLDMAIFHLVAYTASGCVYLVAIEVGLFRNGFN